MARDSKRRADSGHGQQTGKKHKTGRGWQQQRSNNRSSHAGGVQTIEPGDAGIWATCEKGNEGKCVGEVRGILEEYAEKMYNSQEGAEDGTKEVEGSDDDIEAAVRKEVQDIKEPKMKKLFTTVRIDVQCLLFFKTQQPVDPVSVVHQICEDALSSPSPKKSRFIQRLTPVSLMGRASEVGLEELATKVLAPHFHLKDGVTKKFAIRPTIRMHHTLTRDFVINRVAAAVGPGHRVDLTNYDLLILVDIYRNLCGMSVVAGDYDRLKRYNLAEIYHPTPKPNENDGGIANASGSEGFSGVVAKDDAGPAVTDAVESSTLEPESAARKSEGDPIGPVERGCRSDTAHPAVQESGEETEEGVHSS